jgi:carnosine N-methyltransferase
MALPHGHKQTASAVVKGIPFYHEPNFANFCSQYAKVAHFNTTHLRRQSFYALPRAHWELLASPPFSYLDTLNAVDEAIDKNAELSLAIWQAGLESFGIPPQLNQSQSKDPHDWRGKATSNDLEKARSLLRASDEGT